MPNGRIEKGQPLAKAISAAAWNRAQDAADIVFGAQPDRISDPAACWQGASNIVLIKNTTGQDLKAAGVLGIQSLVSDFDASNEMPRIVTRPILLGVSPSVSAHYNKFAITLEPIKNGKIGRAAVSGVIAFRMVDRDPTHGYATVQGGMTDRLQSAECGALHILARGSTGAGFIWAVGVM